MKKQFLLMMAGILLSISAIKAQGGSQQRVTAEERTKTTMESLAPLKLDNEQVTKTAAVFKDLYAAQQKSMEEMRASGNMDREAMQAMRKEMNDKRDAKLKEIFTEAQYKEWKDKIEPSSQPQRRPGGN
jgi:hypothetical protein